ncbi:MAG: CPBP family intramembrane glutamic endopeptidase [Micrococcales bacterium]
MTTRKDHLTQIALVLGVSLGASAIYSLLQLLETVLSPAGIAGSSTGLNQSESSNQFFDLTYQLVGIGLALVPVWLAIYFLHSGAQNFELGGWPLQGKDFLRAISLAAAIGIPGLALYAAARASGFAVQVVAADAHIFWWSIPVLLLSAARSAVVEEVIMVGFLFCKLEQLGFSFAKRNLVSAIIRGCYHAYQGFGGAVGNFVLGLVFGYTYRRWGRVAPLVIAHGILDAIVFVGYALLAKQLHAIGW